MIKTRIVPVFLISGIIALLAVIIYESSGRVVNIWDEALYANNSIEMLIHKSPLTYTYNDVTDHYNSKPPLMLWLQVLGYCLFGVNEFAVRFPGYLALTGLSLFTIVYSRKISGHYQPGYWVVLLMLTTMGLIKRHVFTTGDLDGTLVFFTTVLQLHSWFMAKHKRFESNQFLVLSLLFLGGWLTKSTAVLLVLPSAVLPYIFYKSLRQLLTSKWLYIYGGAAILVILLFYFIRELNAPGYIAIVWFSEFTRIYVNVQPWMEYPREYYFTLLRNDYFSFYYKLELLLLGLVLILRKIPFKKDILLGTAMGLLYLLVISIPDSKMFWYSAPAYPLLCWALGTMIFAVFQWLHTLIKWPPLLFSFLVIACAGGLIVPQAKAALSSLHGEQYDFYELEFEAQYLKENKDQVKNIKRLVVYHPVGEKYIHHLDVIEFYRKQYQLKGKTALVIQRDVSLLQPGDTVLISKQEFKDSLKLRFDWQAIQTADHGTLLTITGKAKIADTAASGIRPH